MVDYSTLLFLWILVLGLDKKLFESPVSLIPYLVHIYLMLSPRPCTYGMTICAMMGLPLEGSTSWLLSLVVVVPLFCGTNMVLLLFCSSTTLPFTIYYFILYLINGPPRVLALTQGIFNVL